MFCVFRINIFPIQLNEYLSKPLELCQVMTTIFFKKKFMTHVNSLFES